MKLPLSYVRLVEARFVYALGIALAVMVLAPSDAISQIRGVTVNTTADGDDASAGNDICETATGNGVCTLRAAIEEANANATTPFIINFNIPTTDAGYDPQSGTWTIQVAP